MGRPRKYKDDAEKQAAYRQRKQAEPSGQVSRAPFLYYGGKWDLAEWIIAQFPKHETYCDLFGGGASVLLQKRPARIEVFNDLNKDVINFFSVLRSHSKKLIRAIELTPYAREEWRMAWEPSNDPLEAARRFYVRVRQSYGPGTQTTSPGWSYQVVDSSYVRKVDGWNKTDHLWETARRLKTVQIECDDALEIAARYDRATTLYYLDPPYVHDTRNRTTGYGVEMTDEDHVKLAGVVQGLKGMVIISGYQSELYADLYAGWQYITKQVKTNSNKYRTECLWISPNAAEAVRQPMLFNVA